MTVQQQEVEPTRDSLKAQALTQRIAEVVAQYEGQMADFRAQATIQQTQFQNHVNDLNTQIKSLNEQIANLTQPTEVGSVEIPQEEPTAE